MSGRAPHTPEDWRPNLFVPGFGKCGTTALCDYLRQHPDVYVTEPKEPHTLSIGLREPAWMRRHPSISRPYYRYLTPKAYRRQLESHSGFRYRADGSQTYVLPSAFPRRLKEFAPDAKLLFMIREQKERLLSLYYFMFKLHRQPEFPEWVENAFAPEADAFLFTGMLEAYHRLYGESMKVIDNRSLLEDPVGVMLGVFEFLGVGAVEVDPLRSNVGGMKALDVRQRRRAAPYLRVTQQLMSPYNYFLNSVDPAGKLESKISTRKVNPLSRYRKSVIPGRKGAPPAREEAADERGLIPRDLAARLDSDYRAATDFCRRNGLLLPGAPDQGPGKPDM